ncbi:kinase-like domain-containing protein [Chaetomium fimeti]|uniref:Kinase-like domain-containing protein n=1 Tax=Chaetomium fimeti TaxID=1854472 RepID=A0AAE0HII2_9PEZI|nr:kinase-like domain-containing protein [Chaetomium fimeti]
MLNWPDMEPPIHVRDSVQQIDADSWLVGRKHVLRRAQGPAEGPCLWVNPSNTSYYTLTDAPVPQPATTPLFPDGHARQIHDAGDISAVFSFANEIIIKIRLATASTRREPETLAFLSKQKLSFDIPTVLSHAEHAGKTYLIEPFVPGTRLNEAWWDMTEQEKEHVVTRVAQVCADIRVFESDAFTNSDANWMDPLRETPDDRVGVVQQQCVALGMDCSVFVLAHNDLGPTNIIVDGDRVVVIDWEMAGYVPLEWVRTKFAICGVFGVERVHRQPDGECPVRVERNGEYPMRVERGLGEMGFPEVTAAYKRMDDMREVEWKKSRPWLQ